MRARSAHAVGLGLRENWRQFSLLIVVNAFVGSMWVQAAGIFATVATRLFGWWLLGSALLRLGTAMVYPSLIVAVSDNSQPAWGLLADRSEFRVTPRPGSKRAPV